MSNTFLDTVQNYKLGLNPFDGYIFLFLIRKILINIFILNKNVQSLKKIHITFRYT